MTNLNLTIGYTIILLHATFHLQFLAHCKRLVGYLQGRRQKIYQGGLRNKILKNSTICLFQVGANGKKTEK